jgi:hypothetical protein
VGHQLPTHPDLYALLTNPAITDGMRVVFRCGLVYTVGAAAPWQMRERPLTRAEAYAELRRAWAHERPPAARARYG